MKTASFKAAGNLPGAISIARTAPKGFEGPCYKDLAPPWELLKRYREGEITWEQYADAYEILVLLALDPHKVYDAIWDMTEPGDVPILCCWESSNDKCHRRLVAEWFTANGIQVEELR